MAGMTTTGPIARLVLSGGAAVAVLALAVPVVSGARWGEIGATLAGVGPVQLAGLAALWLAGLWVHTPSLTAALPGLSHRRAMLLNLTGSFVSNLLPLGGAAGTVVNWRMARTWGFGSSAFARWAVLTNLADTIVKVALPGVVLCWVAAAGGATRGPVVTAAAVGAGALGALVLAIGLVVRDERAVRRGGRLVDSVAARVRWVPVAQEGYGERAAGFRRESASLVRDGWARMLGGKVAYAALQAVLLWACLRVVGAGGSPLVVASAFAVERVLSMVVLTPGAVGVVEVGMVGVLGSLGTAPAAAAAGVLLYRALVVGMEVPVGGLALLGWWASRRPSRLRPRALVESAGHADVAAPSIGMSCTLEGALARSAVEGALARSAAQEPGASRALRMARAPSATTAASVVTARWTMPWARSRRAFSGLPPKAPTSIPWRAAAATTRPTGLPSEWSSSRASTVVPCDSARSNGPMNRPSTPGVAAMASTSSSAPGVSIITQQRTPSLAASGVGALPDHSGAKGPQLRSPSGA